MAKYLRLRYNEGILMRGLSPMKQYTAEELNAMNKEEIVALLMQTQTQNALFME